MNLLVSPHADDETLFAAYVQLAVQPQVVVCLQGRRARHLPRNDVREAESRAACAVLGTDVSFIASPCDPPDWPLVEAELELLEPDRVFAPLPEPGGHRQHNQIGNLAWSLWPDRTTFYATYRDLEKSATGTPHAVEDGWFAKKALALSCYRSQHSKPDTAFHFHRDQTEYLSEGHVDVECVKLNLGAGPNPLEGFDNLDPTYEPRWSFPQPIPYAVESVDAITVSHVLMYVPLEDWPACFAEMARVLAPGGVVRLTEDAIGGEGSARETIRPGAAVATTADLVMAHLRDAGLYAELVTANVSAWHEKSLVQRNYGQAPDVFHVEGWRV